MDGTFRLNGLIDPDLVSRVFRDFETLFGLPEDCKHACRRSDFSSGYTPSGIEGVRDLPKDQFRSFWDVLSAGQNHFPEGFDGSDIESLYDIVERLTVDTFRMNHPHLAHIIDGGMHSMRATHFRPRTADWIVMPCHHDIGLFTSYIGGSRRGLEGKTGDVWEEVENPVGDILIGAGTALRLYDSDVIPFKHRVVSTGESRISIAFFLEPREDVILPNGENAGERLLRIVKRIRLSDR